MTDRINTSPHPKPWTGARLMKQNRKFHKRKHWTGRRWQRYHAEREDKRNHEPIPRALKEIRLRVLWRQQDSAARSARMRAYHEQRRAAKQADVEDIASMVVRGILDNLDAARNCMRDLGMIEIAPGHWRYGVTPPRPSPAVRSPGAA